jgi:pimeloyl-ACP methyl ester carboxylesterase
VTTRFAIAIAQNFVCFKRDSVGMNRRHFISLAVAAVFAVGIAFAPQTCAAETADQLHGLGVVFLHGKGGWPGGFDGGIMDALKEEGALVTMPEMPWSFHRRYDATYDQSLAEIDAAVGGLKTGGANRIVLVGHSLGANVAIGYAARHPELAGVVAIAPGHLPEVGNMRSYVSDAVERAKELIAAGKGNVPQSFPDMAQGIPLRTTATPIVYLSWFDPNGPAVIPKNAAAIGAAPSPVPLLWIVGKLDPIDRRGPEYAFDALAKNPKSQYVEVFAGHLTTALAARRQVIDWINAL